MIKKLCFVAMIFVLTLRCGAQATMADMVGSVLDPSGAGIPHATVVANNVATNVKHTGISEADGDYRIGQLPPGNYDIIVEATGFSRLVRSGVVLQVNQHVHLDLTMQVGQQTQTVEVTGQPPLLETESSSVATVVGERLVNQLPLNGRNFVQLATLTPGVTGVGTSASGTIEGGSAAGRQAGRIGDLRQRQS